MVKIYPLTELTHQGSKVRSRMNCLGWVSPVVDKFEYKNESNTKYIICTEIITMRVGINAKHLPAKVEKIAAVIIKIKTTIFRNI